jgi:hypothetical protein
LKIESSTSITFTIGSEATLILVFENSFSGTVKINATDYTVSNGIISIELEAGTYEIKKGDTANLFYMSITYDNITGTVEKGSSVLSLYPNPVYDELRISSEITVECVQIYSVTGSLLQNIDGNVNRVNMAWLEQGSYIVRVTTVDGAVYRKMMIKN